MPKSPESVPISFDIVSGFKIANVIAIIITIAKNLKQIKKQYYHT